MVGSIIALLIIGLIAGILAKIAMPGPDPGGILLTIIIGIAGSFIGGFITQNLLGFGPGGWIWTILVATLGAVLLLALYRAFANRASH